ncbi:MAG: hypothetical protein GOMPHAMPRED_005408 [Gomphillus americanus]|uniref:Rhodopsin domain-containing protein n=1 Tax=Gomphillus americanus TaxID=1940652 RepID=A0A8H3FQT3_9LECA|nr:MAG: hypothetical protein GOMPHAMPRED_005408 [Gomphillus americanus]
MAMAVPANLTPEEYQFILNLPVMPPPPGIEAQLDQPPDYTGMIIVVVISVVLATVSVLISVYTKLVIMKKPSWADPWMLFVAYIVSAGLITAHGGHTHMWNLRIKRLIDILYVGVGSLYTVGYTYNPQYITFAEAIFGPCNIFLKVSILLQYRIIFATKARNFTWWATNILMILIVVFYVIITFC